MGNLFSLNSLNEEKNSLNLFEEKDESSYSINERRSLIENSIRNENENDNDAVVLSDPVIVYSNHSINSNDKKNVPQRNFDYAIEHEIIIMSNDLESNEIEQNVNKSSLEEEKEEEEKEEYNELCIDMTHNNNKKKKNIWSQVQYAKDHYAKEENSLTMRAINDIEMIERVNENGQMAKNNGISECLEEEKENDNDDHNDRKMIISEMSKIFSDKNMMNSINCNEQPVTNSLNLLISASPTIILSEASVPNIKKRTREEHLNVQTNGTHHNPAVIDHQSSSHVQDTNVLPSLVYDFQLLNIKSQDYTDIDTVTVTDAVVDAVVDVDVMSPSVSVECHLNPVDCNGDNSDEFLSFETFKNNQNTIVNIVNGNNVCDNDDVLHSSIFETRLGSQGIFKETKTFHSTNEMMCASRSNGKRITLPIENRIRSNDKKNESTSPLISSHSPLSLRNSRNSVTGTLNSGRNEYDSRNRSHIIHDRNVGVTTNANRKSYKPPYKDLQHPFDDKRTVSIDTALDGGQALHGRTRLRRQRRYHSEDEPDDPIERLNRLKARISGALNEVKGVLKQYSTDEGGDDDGDVKGDSDSLNKVIIKNSILTPIPDDENESQTLGPIKFRFIKKIQLRSSFAEDAEEENIKDKNFNENEIFDNQNRKDDDSMRLNDQVNEAKVQKVLTETTETKVPAKQDARLFNNLKGCHMDDNTMKMKIKEEGAHHLDVKKEAKEEEEVPALKSFKNIESQLKPLAIKEIRKGNQESSENEANKKTKKKIVKKIKDDERRRASVTVIENSKLSTGTLAVPGDIKRRPSDSEALIRKKKKQDVMMSDLKCGIRKETTFGAKLKADSDAKLLNRQKEHVNNSKVNESAINVKASRTIVGGHSNDNLMLEKMQESLPKKLAINEMSDNRIDKALEEPSMATIATIKVANQEDSKVAKKREVENHANEAMIKLKINGNAEGNVTLTKADDDGKFIDKMESLVKGKGDSKESGIVDKLIGCQLDQTIRDGDDGKQVKVAATSATKMKTMKDDIEDNAIELLSKNALNRMKTNAPTASERNDNECTNGGRQQHATNIHYCPPLIVNSCEESIQQAAAVSDREESRKNSDNHSSDGMPEQQINPAPVQTAIILIEPSLQKNETETETEAEAEAEADKREILLATKTNEIIQDQVNDVGIIQDAFNDSEIKESLAPKMGGDASDDKSEMDSPKMLKPRKERKVKKKVIIKRQKRRLSVTDSFFQNRCHDESLSAGTEASDIETLEKPIAFISDDEDDNGKLDDDYGGEVIDIPKKPLKSCMKVREYEIGDEVLYPERFKKTQIRWKRGKIKERITSISYLIDIDGKEVSSHVNYLKRYTNRKVKFSGKEYLEIDYEQLAEEEEKADVLRKRTQSIWNMV